MDERIKESISALMDDEANELELQRLLSHVEHDELSEKWQRYHLVREAMQSSAVVEAGESSELMNIDISQSVSEWIESDSTDTTQVVKDEPTSQTSVAPKAAGFLAMAASVAFAVVFVMQNNSVGNEAAYPTIAAVEQSSPVETVAVKEPKIIDHIDANHARRLNQYLLRHAEHSMLGARQGAMPFVRVASVNAVGI